MWFCSQKASQGQNTDGGNVNAFANNPSINGTMVYEGALDQSGASLSTCTDVLGSHGIAGIVSVAVAIWQLRHLFWVLTRQLCFSLFVFYIKNIYNVGLSRKEKVRPSGDGTKNAYLIFLVVCTFRCLGHMTRWWRGTESGLKSSPVNLISICPSPLNPLQQIVRTHRWCKREVWSWDGGFLFFFSFYFFFL